MLRFVGRTLIAASLMVAAGVAVNQILDNGKLSWSWGYLAFVFTVLGALAQAAQQAAASSPQTTPSTRRKGSRREYLRRVRSAVGQMETIGLVTQAEYVLRTRQVYVDVMLRPKPVTDAVTDTGIGPGSAAGRRAPLASFLTPGRVLAVLGAAGSGKTTLARYTALEMAERRWSRGRLPVLLYLRDHAEDLRAEEPEGLARVAVAAPWLRGVVSAEWLERRLARGRCVVLLDGLDEVADTRDRGRVVRWVEDQISRYPDNVFVVTSRPLGYDGNRLSRADVLQVQRFTGPQIRAFLHAWYRAIEHRSRQGDPHEIDRTAAEAADDLFRRIGARPTLYDLAANPLLLTMIANVHRYRGSLPGSRAALYEEVCHVLLHRRQEAKNLTDTELDGLSGDKKERVVQELAWYMMRRKLRDIPAEEAERAIRGVLQRTAPGIAPAMFLAHVRRSGLLLEHQYRRYGFAHLTLQEYLAAALVPGHAARRQLLVDHVSDSWWRESTLLWAARADAGPVVEACLKARTVPSLSLAYACASEARELDPELRDRLDRLLTTTPSDPDEIRLLDGVAAARTLHDTHALDDTGTRICAHPVPDDLWNRYATHAADDLVIPGPGTDLWTDDIKRFLTWLNGLFGDGTAHRLPTPSEADRALSSDLYSGTGPVLYAADDDGTKLITAAPRLHPHRPTAEQVGAYSDLILDHTHFIFRLLSPFSPLTFRQLAAYAGDRDLTRTEHRLLHTVDLALTLALSHEPAHQLTRDRALESARDLDLALGLTDAPDDGRSFEQAFYDALVRALDHARALNFELGLAEDQRFAPVSVEALASVLSVLLIRDARHRGLDTGDGLAPDPDAMTAAVLEEITRPVPTNELNRALDRALDREIGLAESGGADLTFTGVFVPARDIPLALDRARRDGTTEPSYIRHLVLARDLVLAQARAISRDLRLFYPFVPHLARDLTFARVAASSGFGSRGTDTLLGTGVACAQLARSFAAYMPARQRRRGEEEASLSRFLDHRLSPAVTWSPADDPAAALMRARHLAESRGEAVMEELIENATRLAAPLWDRSRRVEQSDMVLAATSVLAALTLAEEAAANRELAEHLRSVLCTLIALTPDADAVSADSPSPSKLLVLVRA